MCACFALFKKNTFSTRSFFVLMPSTTIYNAISHKNEEKPIKSDVYVQSKDADLFINR